MRSTPESLENRDENFLLQRMLDNIAFFEAHNRAIARALQATLRGENRKFKLFFDASDINIIDIERQKFLYPKDSFLNLSLQIAQNPLNNALWNLSASNFHLAPIEVKKLTFTATAINNIIEHGRKSFALNYSLPESFLPQTNIFGLGGGLFLQILLERGYFFHSLLIFEEHIELFAISCYFVDFRRLFSQVGEKSCYIFIQNVLSRAFVRHYFYSKKITNNFLRLELAAFMSDRISRTRDMVSEIYRANARGWGSFEDEMIGVRNTLQNLANHRILTHTRKINAPICVVGSGASLESSIEFLRENQDKMLIFSCGTALKVLRAHKIHIDFQIEIERVDYLNEVLKNSALGDTRLICASVVDTKVLESAPNALIFSRGGSSSAYMAKNSHIIEFSAPFVGNTGVSLAANLSDTLILCGLDCGIIRGKSKHARGSFYGAESAEIPKDYFQVRGNGDSCVYSNSIFSLSRENIELAIAHFKPKAVYNLGDGAFISGTIRGEMPRLGAIDKDLAREKMLECFSDNATLRENLSDEVAGYVRDLRATLQTPIATKQEAFRVIDNITAFLAQASFNRPFCGILFEGSMLHLLQNALAILICAPNNDIAGIARDLMSEISHCVEQCHDDFVRALARES